MVEINTQRKDGNSFMVALIATPALPEGIKRADYFTECAVVAVNDVGGNGLYSAVELSADEKSIIGDALAEKCAKMGTWFWCNLYT